MAGVISLQAQQLFPTTDFARLDGSTISSTDLIGQGQPTVVTVWATWCRPCQMELDHFKGFHNRWTNELGAQVIAISVDQPHHVRRIQPMVRQKNWPYEIVVDAQRNLQSLLDFTNIPQLYVLDGEGRIVASYSGYENDRAAQVDEHLVRLANSRK